MFKRCLYLALCFTALAVYSETAFSKEIPQVDEKVILKGQLLNGLAYYIHKTPSAPTLEISLIIKVGSMHETEHEKGLCHLTEHMVSRSLKFQGIELTDKSCPIWNMSQPFLFFEFTQFHFKIPSSLEKGVESCLLTISDIPNGQPLSETVLEEEKQEISKKLEQEDIAYMNFENALISLEYPAYQTSIPGDDQGVCSHATLEQVQNFHKTWYQPDRMAIIVVGNVDLVATQKLIDHLFGKMTSSSTISTNSTKGTVASHSHRALIYVDKNLQESNVFFSKPMPSLMNLRESLIFDIRVRLFQIYLNSLVESKKVQFVDPFYEILAYPQVLRFIVTLPDDQYLEAFQDLGLFIKYITHPSSPFPEIITQELLDHVKSVIRNDLQNLQSEEIQHLLVTFYRDLFVKGHDFIQSYAPAEKISILDSITLHDVKNDIYKFHEFSKDLLASNSVEVIKSCTETTDISENKDKEIGAQ